MLHARRGGDETRAAFWEGVESGLDAVATPDSDR